MKNGQLKPAYNPQISTENQVTTRYSIPQTPGDTTPRSDHPKRFEQLRSRQSQAGVAGAGYGSQENYEYMEHDGIGAFVKYSCFHMEQKRSAPKNIFLPQNLFCSTDQDCFVCPMGQHLTKKGVGTRTSENGYASNASCRGCPLRGQCHTAKGNRVPEVNFRLKELKQKAKERPMSETGLCHRCRRPVEPGAVVGQLKSNNKFNRFTLRSLSTVNVEFGLRAMGHNLRKMAAKTAFSPSFEFLWRLILGFMHRINSSSTYINQNNPLFSVSHAKWNQI